MNQALKVSIKNIKPEVKMSDNFIKIARKEIQDELVGLESILAGCVNDVDISDNAQNLEKHLHKIKGLAPMMGQQGMGDLAKMIDIIIKHVIADGTLEGTYKIITEANLMMKQLFDDSAIKNIQEFRNKIQQSFPTLFY
ncbi:MAG TPA: hypothetical protein VJZ17_05575 [Nitrosopumilaceae archaeon]|nr:hypothetical protein [Nitrosopumilaceae archaeon]